MFAFLEDIAMALQNLINIKELLIVYFKYISTSQMTYHIFCRALVWSVKTAFISYYDFLMALISEGYIVI